MAASLSSCPAPANELLDVASIPRARSSPANVSSYVRRTPAFGVAATTTTFLKARLAIVGSVHDEVSWLVAPQDVSTTRPETATAKRANVPIFMDLSPLRTSGV